MSSSNKNSRGPIFTVLGGVFVQEHRSEKDDAFDARDASRSVSHVAYRVGSWLSEG
jgi:hypothetical protein